MKEKINNEIKEGTKNIDKSKSNQSSKLK